MTFIEIASIASPLAIVVTCWKHRFTLLWFYAATGFCSDVASYWIESRHLVGNIFFLTEFILFSLFFRKQVFKSQTFFYLITLIIIVSYIVKLCNSPLDEFQIFSGGLFSAVYIIYSLITFYKLLKNETFQNSETTFILAVTTVIFVYASGTCLLFLFAQSVDRSFITSVWGTFFIGINIFRYLMIGIALYRKPVYAA